MKRNNDEQISAPMDIFEFFRCVRGALDCRC
jgi:hypothetical protein